MRAEKGSRVGALQSIKDKKATLFGFGIFEGSFDPHTGEECAVPLLGNPRIKLDSGDYVWGFECWWGPEEEIRRRIEGCEVIEVKPVTNSTAPLSETN